MSNSFSPHLVSTPFEDRRNKPISTPTSNQDERNTNVRWNPGLHSSTFSSGSSVSGVELDISRENSFLDETGSKLKRNLNTQ